MDKDMLLKAISIILAMIAVFAFIGALTIKDVGGLMDLSNIMRPVFFIVAGVCGVLAYVLWNSSKERE